MYRLSLVQWALLATGAICLVGQASAKSSLRRLIPPDVLYKARLERKTFQRGWLVELALRTDKRAARRALTQSTLWWLAFMLNAVLFFSFH